MPRPTVGAIAQLGERLNGIQEVVGSIPIGSTRVVIAGLEICWPGRRTLGQHAQHVGQFRFRDQGGCFTRIEPPPLAFLPLRP